MAGFLFGFSEAGCRAQRPVLRNATPYRDSPLERSEQVRDGSVLPRNGMLYGATPCYLIDFANCM